MKNKNIICILLCLTLTSCGEDRRIAYAKKNAATYWAENIMRENYYWYQDVPNNKSLNYFDDIKTFFKKLLSSNDRNYSYVEDPTDTDILKSYGIKFDASYLYNDTAYAVRVLYVESDSPAKEAQLNRGDWIIKRNGKYITKNRIDSLYKGDAITVTLGEYTTTQDENGNDKFTFVDNGNPVSLAAARITQDNPIQYVETFTTPSGKRVGYMVYNHFTQGTDRNDSNYDEYLRTYSNTFKSENITNFILDLRYNTGGSIESAQLLGSILVPEAAIGETMCKLIYNDKQTDKNQEILFSNDALAGGSNLNPEKLYIITGSNTGATSDVLINCLKPYMEVVLVGKTTTGNYTGTHAYTDESIPYILHPVDCMIYNAEESVEEQGFTPNATITDTTPAHVTPFGYEKGDPYLAKVISIIEGETKGTETKETTRSGKITGYCTLDKKQFRGTTIRNNSSTSY